MISSIKIYEAAKHNTYENIALEKYLFDHVSSQEMILFLWVNAPSVIIGRNQNPYKECNLSLMQEEGVLLARRLSGGGAVFHDTGNLNFTFISFQENMNISRNLNVIKEAVRSFGLDAQISGRNDLTIDGFKFSGNAFLNSASCTYHHGTIMIDVDASRLSDYLNVDAKKLKAKGLDSVRSRVCNLAGLNKKVNLADMKMALKESFAREYNLHPETDCIITAKTYPEVSDMAKHFASNEWIMGSKADCQYRIHERFAWGDFDLNFDINNGVLSNIVIYTDALDQDLAPSLTASLNKLPADYNTIAGVVNKIATDSVHKSMATDILQLIKTNL